MKQAAAAKRRGQRLARIQLSLQDYFSSIPVVSTRRGKSFWTWGGRTHHQ